ncbi:MAG: hypothetical protein VB100_03815 [Angelakisella sp.]|nr:hypothetical protein [Angelakisella sp.]
MGEKVSFTPEQISLLIKVAAAKMGKDPLMLRKELENGSLDSLLGGMGADKDKVRDMLGNKNELEQMLSSPQVIAMIRGMMGK